MVYDQMVLCDKLYDKSHKLRKEEGFFLNIQFWIKRLQMLLSSLITGKNISSDHDKNLTFKIFSAFQK